MDAARGPKAMLLGRKDRTEPHLLDARADDLGAPGQEPREDLEARVLLYEISVP